MSDRQVNGSGGPYGGSPWTPKVRDLLEDWRERADATEKTHHAMANRRSLQNTLLGVPVVVLTTFVATSVFANLQQNPPYTGVWILAGFVSVLAAVLAGLETFLRLGERAEMHRTAAEKWSAIRREISEMLALHPKYLATRDPRTYLDDLRKRMDEIATESPEMPDRRFARALSEETHPSRHTGR